MGEGEDLTEEEYLAEKRRKAAELEAAAIEGFRINMRQMLMDLDALDTDRDRTLDFYEYSRLIKEREMGVHTRDALRCRFDNLDQDGSGLIDYAEFVAYALRESFERSSIKAEALHATWNTSGDGKVSRAEFRAALRDLYGAQMTDAEIDRVTLMCIEPPRSSSGQRV